MRSFKIITGAIILVLATYFLGPVMPNPLLNSKLPVVCEPVSEFVSHLESLENVGPGNEARIIWSNDSTHAPTDYVLLYLHGFSASRREGFPLNEDFPRKYKCNAYMARLASHGLITENPLLDMTPNRLYESAKMALMIASHLGNKVIIMGTSTGGTLALKLAADFPDMVYGLILYSPNVSIKQKASLLLSKPWGLQIARLTFGGDFRVLDKDPSGEYCGYWYCRYRAEGTVYLQQLLDVTMNDEVFSKVRCPLFLGYYYKDEEHQDQIVDVQSELDMFRKVSTPESKKRARSFPEAGNHVIECDLISKSVPEVANATYEFAESILKMVPK